MKSFSATGFATGQGDVIDSATAAVSRDPLALFTDFQWFLYKARNTVYFTAFSRQGFDRQGLMEFVGNMVTLAPQLTHGFWGAKPGQPLARYMLEEITSVEEVDSFDGYPDRFLTPAEEIFERSDLPLFRVRAAVLRNGPDAEGRAAMVIVQSSHALMEGADSALLSRSRNSGHGIMSSSDNRVALRDRLAFFLTAALSAPVHLVTAHVLSPEVKQMGFRSLAFDRGRLRDVSNRIGVSQRALMYGVVMFALNDGGQGFSKKRIRTVYTTLDTDRRDVDDDFFRVRSVEANFDVHDDLLAFIRHVDARLAEVERKDTSHMQFVLNATFRMHRLLYRLVPFFYGSRFFRFNGNYDMVLTLVPPHRMYGNLTAQMMEPVYCGSYHPGSNLCTFVPTRKHVTFNFSTDTRHLPQAGRVEALLEKLEMYGEG